MRPAREGGIPVRVKNSYNRHAPGTVITTTRDMRKVCSMTISVYCFSSMCNYYWPLIALYFSEYTNQHCVEIKYHHA
jgi:aspartokinase